MITVEAALSDLDKMISETDDKNTKILVKGIKVLVKFLSTIRTNQLLSEDEKKQIRESKNKKTQ